MDVDVEFDMGVEMVLHVDVDVHVVFYVVDEGVDVVLDVGVDIYIDGIGVRRYRWMLMWLGMCM